MCRSRRIIYNHRFMLSMLITSAPGVGLSVSVKNAVPLELREQAIQY
jgi:hypothetical protein